MGCNDDRTDSLRDQESRLRLGVRVVIKVNDAAAHAVGLRADRPGSILAVTLADGSGVERPVPFETQSGGTYEYSYLAPAQKALRLKVSSSQFLLADGSGLPIDERGHVFPIVTPLPAARKPGVPNIRLPFTAPRFGPPPVVVSVGIRGRR